MILGMSRTVDIGVCGVVVMMLVGSVLQAGTGAPMHYHRTALNMLAFGQKYWAVRLPEDALYSVQPLTQQREQDGSDQITCTQHSGDIVLMPSQFAHATLNVRPSIGMAFEFNYDGTPEPLQAR